jgi:hypothetical protein
MIAPSPPTSSLWQKRCAISSLLFHPYWATAPATLIMTGQVMQFLRGKAFIKLLYGECA